MQAQDWEKAERNLRKALQEIPLHPEATLFLAQACWGRGNKEEARRLMDELLDKEREFASGYFLRAKFWQEEKNYEMARADFERAADFDPKNSTVWHELGKTLLTLNRSAEALTAFSKATRLDPFMTPSELSVLFERHRTGS